MRLWLARLAALGAVTVALYLTLRPDSSSGLLPAWAGHLVIFAGVGTSFAFLRAASRWPRSGRNLLALTVVTLSVATEVGQGFTGRSPDLIDLVLDLAAGLATLLALDGVSEGRRHT